MRTTPLALVALLMCLMPLQSAWAQGSTSWSLFGPADFRPEIGDAQMAIIVRALGLDEDETALARDLHRGHADRVRRESTAFRERVAFIVEEAQMMGDGAGVGELYDLGDEWREQRQALDDDFLNDLKLILS